MARASLLKPIRTLHLYFGVFITPALIFFAFTGAVQTFSFHETTRGSSYQPPAILVRLAQLHKKQTLEVPNKKPKADIPAPTGDSGKHQKNHPAPADDSGKPSDSSAATPSQPPTAPPNPPAAKARTHNLWPMKIFFLIASIGLLSSTLTGLYMSYNFVRNKLAITATLAAGVVIPLLLLLF